MIMTQIDPFKINQLQAYVFENVIWYYLVITQVNNF